MKVCPTCRRPFGGTQRTCFSCGKAILRDHKWHAVGCYMMHDNCADPKMRVLFKPDPAAESVPLDLEPTDEPISHKEENGRETEEVDNHLLSGSSAGV